MVRCFVVLECPAIHSYHQATHTLFAHPVGDTIPIRARSLQSQRFFNNGSFRVFGTRGRFGSFRELGAMGRFGSFCGLGTMGRFGSFRVFGTRGRFCSFRGWGQGDIFIFYQRRVDSILYNKRPLVPTCKICTIRPFVTASGTKKSFLQPSRPDSSGIRVKRWLRKTEPHE